MLYGLRNSFAAAMQKHASNSSYPISLAFAGTTRGSWRVTPHDAALCSSKECAFFDSTGATVSTRRAAAGPLIR
jgi:hypothetical protein